MERLEVVPKVSNDGETEEDSNNKKFLSVVGAKKAREKTKQRDESSESSDDSVNEEESDSEERKCEEGSSKPVVQTVSRGIKVPEKGQESKQKHVVVDDDDEAEKTPELTKKDRRKLEQQKTKSSFYDTHNVKNKNREKKPTVNPDGFRGHTKKKATTPSWKKN